MHLVEPRGSSAPHRWQCGFSALVAGLAIGSVLLVLTAAPPALAAQDAAEPRVARVGFVEGETSYLNADADEWTPVDVNAPLVTGDRFYAGPDGRAEIELPGGVDARLSSETELDLLEVSSAAVQLRLGEGTATFRVRDVPAGLHVEISTPTAAVVARSRGIYRIDVAADGQTTVLVRDGEADAFAGDQRYRLEQGRGARIAGGTDAEGGGAPPIEVFDANAVPSDPWDQWEQGRAARVVKSASVKYVDPDVYGVQDLDQYGSWSRDESYGPIWRPTQVDAGWAPFTQGRWVWQDPWGWTWVDYAPWGWAPSHYGRWVYAQDAWAWAPGPVVARPVYAPATVGFFGLSVDTPGVSVSVGIGPSVGWVPLGYGEPLIPWWGGFGGVQRGHPWWGGWGGPRIVNNTVINQTNITNVNVNNIHYANFDRPRGFTAVSRDSFVRGDLQRVDVPRERLHEIAHPSRGGPDAIPQRDSLFATRPEKMGQGRGKEPSREVLQRASVSTRAVPGPRPAFDDKIKLIEQGKGAPVAPRELQQLTRGNGKGNGAQPQIRTVAAQGRHAVVPDVTADAPAQADAPIQRRARAANPADGRQASANERGDRAAAPANPAQTRDAAPRRGQPQGGDGPRDARSTAQREQRDTAPAAREPLPAAGAGRVGEAANPTAGRAAVARPAGADRTVANGGSEAARGERGVPAQRAAAPDVATRAAHQQPQPRTERATREAVAAPQRDAAQQQPAQAERQRQAQREQAGRTQRDDAARQQHDSDQRAQAQQQQAERSRQAAASQQRDGEERARVQAERQQQQADRARQDTARQQRDGAARAQRDAQQAARQSPPPQQQRQQAVERQHSAPPPNDPREAKHQEHKKPQQQERDRQPGA